MHYDDYPFPQILDEYKGCAAFLWTDIVEIIFGTLPRRAISTVRQWAMNHQVGLHTNWQERVGRKHNCEQ